MATTDHGVTSPTRAHIDARTLRQDRWWLQPLTTFVVFSAFVVYATVRAFMGRDYYASPYLSPFYSPCLGDCVEGASDFGQPFASWPAKALRFPYMCTSTKPMKMRPEIAIRSLSAMVERDARAPLTRDVVDTCSTVPRAVPSERRRECDICLVTDRSLWRVPFP